MSTRNREAAPAALRRAVERFRGGQPPGTGVEALRRSIDTVDADASRRREDLVTRAVEISGLTRAQAELIHDIASAEGLDPAFAFELVRSRVAVCDTQPESPAPPDDTLIEGAPEWLAPSQVTEPLPTEDVVRERRLRLSFRRLRGHLERHATVESAIEAFGAEPDVGDCGYLLD